MRRNTFICEECLVIILFSEFPVRCAKRCKCNYLQDQKANVLNCSNSRINFGNLKLPEETNWLIADSNKIPKLCPKFTNIQNITYINLHSSGINTICDEFWYTIIINGQLRHLNLGNNSIKMFSHSLKELVFLRQIYLGQNPIECTCDTLWFSDWLVNFTNPSGERIIQDYQNVTCFGGKWDEIPVYKLDPIEMECYPVFTM